MKNKNYSTGEEVKLDVVKTKEVHYIDSKNPLDNGWTASIYKINENQVAKIPSRYEVTNTDSVKSELILSNSEKDKKKITEEYFTHKRIYEASKKINQSAFFNLHKLNIPKAYNLSDFKDEKHETYLGFIMDFLDGELVSRISDPKEQKLALKLFKRQKNILLDNKVINPEGRKGIKTLGELSLDNAIYVRKEKKVYPIDFRGWNLGSFFE